MYQPTGQPVAMPASAQHTTLREMITERLYGFLLATEFALGLIGCYKLCSYGW